ncbi:hypothetical protein Scep_001329 [Stephania cephalantha]|uniref:Uncharacterized protein n=1 Tax=Stephania cephalantha TaxID=152367 RepID=A0AAP0L7S0_9MAGN
MQSPRHLKVEGGAKEGTPREKEEGRLSATLLQPSPPPPPWSSTGGGAPTPAYARGNILKLWFEDGERCFPHPGRDDSGALICRWFIPHRGADKPMDYSRGWSDPLPQGFTINQGLNSLWSTKIGTNKSLVNQLKAKLVPGPN